MKIIITFLILLFSFQLQAQMFKLPKYYMPIGLNVGGGGNGKVIGGEASFVFAGDGFGYGAFIDSLKTKTGNRIFAGAEIFIQSFSDLVIGFEAGAATNTGTSKSGFMSGFFLVMENPFIPYIRYFNLSGKSTCEAGILFKIPIPLS